MKDLDEQDRRDKALLELARDYRRNYRAWRKLDRDPTSHAQDRVDAHHALSVAERALLAAARGER